MCELRAATGLNKLAWRPATDMLREEGLPDAAPDLRLLANSGAELDSTAQSSEEVRALP